MRKLVVALVASLALIFNPLYACDEIIGSKSFEYSDVEMRAAVEGTWELTLSKGTQTQRITLRIRQADAVAKHSANGFITSASACSQRSFVKTAGACLDTTEMPLRVVIEGAVEIVVRGQFMVVGTKFTLGELFIPDIPGGSIHAQITPNGNVAEIPDNAIDFKRIAR